MNRLAYRIFFIAVILGLCIHPSLVYAKKGDDWQYWNDMEIQKRIAEDWALKFHTEQWLRDDFTDLYTYIFDGGVLWSPYNFLEITPSFRYEHEKDARGRKTSEKRWYLDAVFKQTFKKIKFSDRSRIEYRDKNIGSDFWRYRNRVKAAYPLNVRGFQFSPYVSEELFWDISNHQLNQNRLAGGISWNLSKPLTLSTYYMWRSRKSGSDWNDEHILGTSLVLSL